MIPVQLIVAGAIAAASFAGAWGIQENRHASILAQYQTDHATALAEATKDALARTIALQKAKDDAERKARNRIADLKRDAASASSALVGLSHATDQALRHASDSHSACLNDANNLAIVFGRCTTKLQGVAADADLLSSNVQTLVEAWPSSKP